MGKGLHTCKEMATQWQAPSLKIEGRTGKPNKCELYNGLAQPSVTVYALVGMNKRIYWDLHGLNKKEVED